MDSKQILENPQEKQNSAKKGGPYTEPQKLERQNKVYHLHFEKGYSAVRIAEELGVNRNTINSDIKELFIQLADELPKCDLASLFLSQLHTLKAQKARLVDSLANQSEQKSKILYEKLIFDIDWKISQLVVKLITIYKYSKSLNIKEILSTEKNN